MTDLLDRPAVKAALTDPALGRIAGVHQFDPSPAIAGLNKPALVVSIHSDQKRQTVEIYRKFVLVFQNSYLLSFVDNLGLAWLYHAHVEEIDIDAFGFGFSKKMAAEQLHVLQPSDMSRTLFLEAIMAYEPNWRVPVLARAQHAALDASSKTLTRMTADFMMHHEIGHMAETDARFDQFVKPVVKEYLETLVQPDWCASDMALLREEAEADIFGINCCLATYAPHLSAAELRNYLIFVVRSVVAMNVVYAFADDLHRVNLDPDHVMKDINQTLGEWQHREAIAVTHIHNIQFDDLGLATQATSQLLDLPNPDTLFASATRGEDISAIQNEDIRRMATVLNEGFAVNHGFDAIIKALRQDWLLEGDDVIHEI